LRTVGRFEHHSTSYGKVTILLLLATVVWIVLYILHATTDITEYAILGEAYVHGVVDRELWTWDEEYHFSFELIQESLELFNLCD
jgi:hypothetical protein